MFDYAGDALLWAVVLPAYAWAALRTGSAPRWIGWVGLVSAAFAGWLGLLAPASSVIVGLTLIGFVGFFVWTTAMGLALLRRGGRAGDELVRALQ